MICSALSLLALASFATTQAAVVPIHRTPHLSPRAPSYTIQLTSTVPRRASKADSITRLRANVALDADDTGLEQLAGASYDQEYVGTVSIGGQDVSLIIDTGSSDTWVVGSVFECVNVTTRVEEEQSACNFGSAAYDPTQSSTFENFTYPAHLNISYGDGEFVIGYAAYEAIEVGGLTVPKQEFAVVTYAGWNGDSVTSGLLGLAHSGITSVYNGSDPSQDSAANQAPYSPWPYTAASDNLYDGKFSLALNRGNPTTEAQTVYDSPLGYVSFGELPPVETTGTTATVDMLHYGNGIYLYYNVNVSYSFTGSELVYSGSSTSSSTGSVSSSYGNTIVDSGTTLNYIESSLAKAYNAQFEPPAEYDFNSGLYYVDCDATAPEFKVLLGGVDFTIDGKDQILYAGTDSDGNSVCISGTQDGGENSIYTIFILGDVFLHNVVSTFDIINNEISFTQRTAY